MGTPRAGRPRAGKTGLLYPSSPPSASSQTFALTFSPSYPKRGTSSKVPWSFYVLFAPLNLYPDTIQISEEIDVKDRIFGGLMRAWTGVGSTRYYPEYTLDEYAL